MNQKTEMPEIGTKEFNELASAYFGGAPRKKQTAVEWLQEQLQKGINYNPIEKNGYSNAEQKLFEQAKEKEKEQIMNAYDEIPLENFNGAEDYYNKTNKL